MRRALHWDNDAFISLEIPFASGKFPPRLYQPMTANYLQLLIGIAISPNSLSPKLPSRSFNALFNPERSAFCLFPTFFDGDPGRANRLGWLEILTPRPFLPLQEYRYLSKCSANSVCCYFLFISSSVSQTGSSRPFAWIIARSIPYRFIMVNFDRRYLFRNLLALRCYKSESNRSPYHSCFLRRLSEPLVSSESEAKNRRVVRRLVFRRKLLNFPNTNCLLIVQRQRIADLKEKA